MSLLLDGSKQAVWLLRKHNLGRGSEQSAEESSFREHGEECVMLLCSDLAFTEVRFD